MPLIIWGWAIVGFACLEPDRVRVGSADDSDGSADTQASWHTGLPAPEIAVRPHEVHPNLLHVSWSLAEAATVHLEFELDGAWYAGPSRDRSAGEHEELLVGLPYDTRSTVAVVVDGPAGAGRTELQVETAEPPAGLPLAEVVVHDTALADAASEFVLTSLREPTLTGRSWTVIIDRQARVRWARSTPGDYSTAQAQLSYDGLELLIEHNSAFSLWDEGAASHVLRLLLDGTTVAEHPTPGLHFSFTELPDGSVVWGARDEQDEHVERLWADGSTGRVWSCGRGLALMDGVTCASNGLYWSDLSQSLIWSSYTLDTVVDIEPSSGQAVRWFGQAEGAWDFDPPESAFWWQHGAHLTADGTLLLSTMAAEATHETVVREYEMDGSTETLRELWSYSDGSYTGSGGEVLRTASGTTLHALGVVPTLREITPAGEVAWEVAWDASWVGRLSVVHDLQDLVR